MPVRADTLAGEHTLAEEGDDGEDAGEASPAAFALIDQDKLEILLRAKAEALGADLRFATELVSGSRTTTGSPRCSATSATVPSARSWRTT